MSSALAVIYVAQYVGPVRRAALGITTDSAAGRKKMNGLVRALDMAGASVVLLSFGGRWRSRSFRFIPGSSETVHERLNVEYAPVWDWPLLTGISAVLGVCRLLRRTIREQRAAGRDVCVIFYNATIEATLVALYSRLLGVPVCLELSDGLHVDPTVRPVRRAVFSMLRILLTPVLNGCLLASSTMRPDYASLPTAVYSGIAFPELVSQDRVRLDDPDVISGAARVTCLFAGSLDEVRGARLLMASLQRADADETFPADRLRVVIMGRGPLEADVRLACASLRRVRAEFDDFTENTSSLRDALSRAHVGLALQDPALDFSRYCFPIKLIDYPAAGALVITTNVADIANLASGVLLLDSGTPEAVVDAWRKVVAEPDRYAGIARAGQRMTLELWSLARVGREVTALLRKIVPVTLQG